MANPWGTSWGTSWGNSWLSSGVAPPVAESPRPPRPSDNESRIYKPTGLLPKRKRKDVEQRVVETRQIHEDVAERLAREFTLPELESVPVERMSIGEIESEIGLLLRKKMQEEDDRFIILMTLTL